MNEQLKLTNCENCPIVEKAAWALALHNYKARDAEGNVELRQVRTEKEWKEWLTRAERKDEENDI